MQTKIKTPKSRTETTPLTDTNQPEKYRVQIDLPPKAMDRLNSLKLKTEASSYGEVMKTAMRVYEMLITETGDGNKFLIKNKDGSITPFTFIL